MAKKKKKNTNTKRILLLLLMVVVTVVVVAGGTFAFFSATANTTGDRIDGETLKFDITLDIDAIKSDALIPVVDNLVTTSLNSANSCVDSRGYAACSIYKLTLTNNGNAQTLNGYMQTRATTYTTNHLKYGIYTKSGNTYTLISDTKNTDIVTDAKNTFTLNNTNIEFDIADGTNTTKTKDYYLVVWLSDIGSNQLEDQDKTYSGSIVFENANGAKISAIFGSILPDEYQEVEYLENTSNQYIDTLYYLNSNNITIKTKVYTSDMPTAEKNIISNQDSSTGRFVLGFYQNKLFGYSRNASSTDTNVYSSTYSGSNTFEIEMIYDYTNHQKTMKVNGSVFTQTQNASIANNNQTLKLYKAGNANSLYFEGRIYYLQIYVDNTLVKNYIPCYHKTSLARGMYDTVNGNFLTNAGGGTFAVGPDV